MSIGLKGNADGSGAIQIGGSDAITITTGLNTTFLGTATVPTGTLYPLVSSTVNAGGTNPFPSSLGPSSVDYTNLPSWVKRITIMLSGVSVSGTDSVLLRLGTGAGPTYASTGYANGNVFFNGATVGSYNNPTTGFFLTAGSSAAGLNHGVATLALVSGTVWAISGSIMMSGATRGITLGGSLDAGAALTAIRFVTETTNTFDAGSINILYE